MTPKELAQQLTQQLAEATHPGFIPRGLAVQARNNRLVILCNFIDDELVVEGAVRDSTTSVAGDTFYLTAAGLIENACGAPDCPYFAKQKHQAISIGRWRAPEIRYEADIAHETFSIVVNNVPYCRGIIFSMDAMYKIVSSR